MTTRLQAVALGSFMGQPKNIHNALSLRDMSPAQAMSHHYFIDLTITRCGPCARMVVVVLVRPLSRPRPLASAQWLTATYTRARIQCACGSVQSSCSKLSPLKVTRGTSSAVR